MGLEELKSNCREMEETDAQSHVIPAITLVGKETGLTSEAVLVPQVSDTLGKDSGMGVLPMILAHGGNAVQVPSTAEMKQELFNFLRAVVKPVRLRNREEWNTAFDSDTWSPPPLPGVMWPAPDSVVRSAEKLEVVKFVLVKLLQYIA